MAAVVIQSATAFTANYVQNSTIAPASAVTSGNFLLLFIGTNGTAANNVTGVTDTLGNTWVKITSTVNNSRIGDFWYVLSAIAGTPTITVTTTNFLTRAIILREYSGLATVSPVDVSGSIASTGTAHSVSATTTNANDLIVGAFVGDVSANTYTLGTGFSNLTTANGGDFVSSVIENKTVSATGSQAANLTSSTSTSGNMSILALKVAGGTVTVNTTNFFHFF